MYKQKSWNVENMHMGVIKAFIVVSMLFVCMFSMKISARASENIYVTSNAGTHTHVWKDYSDNYVMTETFTLSDETYYYFWSKVNSAYYLKRYNILDDSISNVGTITVNKHQVYNDGKVSENSNEVTKHWRNDFCFESKFVSSTLPVFDSDNSAINYIRTGNTSGLLYSPIIEPTFTDEDIYDPQYSFIGFDCGQLYGATWEGVTEPFIDTTLENIEEKVQIRLGYYDFETKELIHFTLSIVDTSVGRWAELRESVHDRVHGELSYLEFTPFYINNGQIYYGQSIQYNIRDKQTSGTGHNHIADDDSYYVSSVIKGSHENTLGYLQGVSMKRGNDSTGSKMLYVSWDISNKEFADCRIEVYLRYKQQNIYGKMYYCTFPYITYDSASEYLTEHYALKIFDMDTYYQKNGFNIQFSHTYQLDKIFVRLVRYDEENDKYYYGGMVSIDNATLNSEGVNTVQIDNGGVVNTDTTSDDSYSTGQTNFIGQDVNGNYPVISLDTIGGSVTTIMSSLNDMRSLYSQGSYDSFLRTSFTFIPSEIWAIIISGLSVIVGFLIIKLIARVL